MPLDILVPVPPGDGRIRERPGVAASYMPEPADDSTQKDPSASAGGGLGQLALIGLVYLALALGLAVTSGALESGFGAFEDEPSHLMGGLLVRDYLADGMPGHPLPYAENYYLHYPKIAIGQWPPGLPGMVGVWTLIFGTSALAILALFATISAAVATVIFRATRADCGRVPAVLGGALFLLLPLSQEFGHMVMTELPQALWCTLAVLAFGRFLDEERTRSVMGFAFFSVLAILTKGNGIFLAFVPPLAIGLTGRWHLLKRPALWLSGLVVGVCCAPWYWLTIDISRTTWGDGSSPTWEYSKKALATYGAELWWLAGMTAGAVAGLGLALRLLDTKAARAGRWAAMIAWLPALFACIVIVPTGVDPRHLLLIAPVWIMGWAAGAASIGAGLEWLAGARGSTSLRLGGALASLALLGVFFADSFERPAKDYRGFRAAAQTLQGDESLDHSVFLVASDSKGEGLFVTAVALGEERPGHVVLRASQVLSTSDWMGQGFELLYSSPDELAAFLAELPVGIVAFDASTPKNHWTAHHDLLLETLLARPEEWVELPTQEVVRGGEIFPQGLRLFRLVGHEGREAALPELERLLGRKLPGF